ncbi:MAG: hypothetical protein K8T25_18100 [Planctomycetia bacterium]|nr:hypothetical protein [Planctomycetia bacterium]
MGRPKTIHIDATKLLAGIRKATVAARLELRAELAREVAARNPLTGYLRQEIQDTRLFGAIYDIPKFLGYWPTPSERIRCQQAIKGLEVDGLVERFNRRIRVTDAGRARLKGVPDA